MIHLLAKNPFLSLSLSTSTAGDSPTGASLFSTLVVYPEHANRRTFYMDTRDTSDLFSRETYRGNNTNKSCRRAKKYWVQPHFNCFFLLWQRRRWGNGNSTVGHAGNALTDNVQLQNGMGRSVMQVECGQDIANSTSATKSQHSESSRCVE